MQHYSYAKLLLYEDLFLFSVYIRASIYNAPGASLSWVKTQIQRAVSIFFFICAQPFNVKVEQKLGRASHVCMCVWRWIMREAARGAVDDVMKAWGEF